MEGINILVPATPMVMVQRMGDVAAPPSTTASSNAEIIQYMSPNDEMASSSLNHSCKPQYKFVDSKKPSSKRIPPTRAYIRRHANRDTHPRLKWNRYATSPVERPSRVTLFKDPSVPLSLGLSTALSSFHYPLDMQPGTHALLEQYLTHATNRMYPLRSCFKTSPFRSPQWFHFAVNDAAMLHGVLFAGAVYLALLQGKRETQDTMYHENAAISIVQKRLETSDCKFDDAILGTISCLALGDVSDIGESRALELAHARHPADNTSKRENVKSSSLSSSKAPSARFPISQLPLVLIQNRVDVTGAIDYAERPYLDFERSTTKSIWSNLPLEILQQTRTDMTELLTMSEVHPSLVPIMTHLAYFTLTIEENKAKRTGFFDPIMFAEDLHWIEHNLLSFPTTLPAKTSETSLDSAIRFGALLYTKSTLQEFPNSMTGPSILLARLQESLSEIEISVSITPLLAWLSLIGAVLSIGEGREWFVARLGMLRATNRATSFEELAGGMNRLLCLRSVFGNACEDIWTGHCE
ncbi:hypothetical protein BKA64DRAFT_707667 [Cadophora sp. MPI-SDFR-AT-0126]|nr:hypothetical protein BKA64DRAFT_707667 [Leotiomycetes sp. MPI-SDFR-AT-0126]